jgi:hypothetical protein
VTSPNKAKSTAGGERWRCDGQPIAACRCCYLWWQPLL